MAAVLIQGERAEIRRYRLVAMVGKEREGRGKRLFPNHCLIFRHVIRPVEDVFLAIPDAEPKQALRLST